MSLALGYGRSLFTEGSGLYYKLMLMSGLHCQLPHEKYNTLVWTDKREKQTLKSKH